MSQPAKTSLLPEGKNNLFSKSFLSLCLTQLLTGINDNTFRWLVIGIGKQYVEYRSGHIWGLSQSSVLGLGLICFVTPYIVLATHAGYVSDRFSKRRVIVACKLAEVLIMAMGSLAIYMESPLFIFTALTLMGAQSAMFYPAKMGAIPEIVKSSKLSPANGYYNMMTVVGTLGGMFLGGYLADYYGGENGNFLALKAIEGSHPVLLISQVVVGIAIVGTIISLGIDPLQVANKKRKFPFNALKSMWNDLQILHSNRALFRIAIGIMFFWAVSAVAQNNIDQFVVEAGAGSETDRTPFLVVVVLGICVGSVLAGVMSGDRVELGILPIAAFGIAVSTMLLFTVDSTIFDKTRLGIAVKDIHEGESTVVRVERSPAPSSSAFQSDLQLNDQIVEVDHKLISSRDQFDNVVMGFQTANQDQLSTATVDLLVRRQAGGAAGLEDVRLKLKLEPSSEIQWEYFLACLLLAGVGFSAGLFEVPLTAFLQHRSPRENLGAILAATNLLTFLGMLLMNGMFMGLRMETAEGVPFFSSRHIFFTLGLLTIPIAVYIVVLIPSVTIKFVVWTLSKTVYRVRLKGLQNLPETGGALLVPNHVTWIDGILLLLASERPIRMVVFSGNFQNKLINAFGRIFGVIMITPGRRSVIKALDTAAKALDNGELVCIFPEGALTKSGQIQAFKPGMKKILDRCENEVPVIPIYLDGLWGSVFSYSEGKYFWKLPRQIPYPVWVHFGKPVSKGAEVYEYRQAVSQLGAKAVNQRIQNESQMTCQFIRECKRNRKPKISDSSGNSLTGSEVLLRSLILRKLLNRHVLEEEEQYVGVLIPQSVGGAVTNMALALDRRVAVHLNYTVSPEVINACCKQAGITTILGSRLAMKRFNFDAEDLDAEVFYLEDLRKDGYKPTLLDKLTSLFVTKFSSANSIIKSLGLDEIKPDDILTVIFTSGSTGIPKGVMLTHANVASNVEAINQIAKLKPDDMVIGILPFFHSMGFTVTIWTPLCQSIGVAYHPNPLEAKKVGEITEKSQGTVMVATPTFLRSYLRRVTPEQFKSLDIVITGA
ncbi:MAG: MFS transporter, partial [Planctomycetota bacterium]|nr:MFS transporter [Planctomycetota bacterium]